MNIGSFKSTNGQLIGSVATATIDLPRLGLRPIQSTNDKAPAFEIMTLNPARRWVQIGALWEQTSNSTGEVFYQGKLDDPSLPEPLPIMLFGDAEEGYRVAWNRPVARRENLDGTKGKARRQRASDDGFGTGDATADGQMVGGDEGEGDDRLPAFA